MTDLPEHLERKWPGYVPGPRLIVGMILAGSLAVCGTAGTEDLRRDQERQEILDERQKLIEAMNDMALSKLHFGIEVERLFTMEPVEEHEVYERSHMGVSTEE